MNDILHDWQKTGRLLSSYKKLQIRLVILAGRRCGKSTITQDMMRMKFTSSWTKWENTWLWKPKKSSRSNRLIIGNVMVRKNKFMINNGTQIIEYASLKEALTQQREEFKEILSRG